MAGELGLDVYVICLSRAGLDDTALSELISELPERCIALMEDIDAAFHHGLTREAESPNPPPAPTQTTETAQNTGRVGGNQTMRGSSASRLTLSGLLNALDGVGAQEGRILYATTNKYSALDPALCRPGRMDLHVEFKLASKYQAQELFRCFYLPADDASYDSNVINDDDNDGDDDDDEKGSVDSGYSSVDQPPSTPLESSTAIPTTSEIPVKPSFTGDSHRARAPKLTRRQVADLASSFSGMIPEREFSMASLQGYLMTYKTRPYEAVKDATAWVEKERADKIEKQNAANGTPPTTATVPADTPASGPSAPTVDSPAVKAGNTTPPTQVEAIPAS
jgi:chaperone BCS1